MAAHKNGKGAISKTTKTFDLIIIGGGAGAFAAAIRAKHHGVSGVELEVKNFDFQKVVQDELLLVENLRQEKYEKVLKNLEHVAAIEGKAKFVAQNEVEVNGEKLSAEKFIIAAGSTANVPPIEGIREVGFVTHIEALRLEKQSKELVIIGAGPLGLEFAQMFARFGTKVTVLQRGDLIFPHSEKALIDRLAGILSKEGIAIKTNVDVKSACKKDGKKVVSYGINGTHEETSADEILLAAGKTPNTQGLGLDVGGVEIDKRQAVVVNQYLQTSNKNVFAVSDVTNGPLRLEPTAGREGTLAAENALKEATLSIDYSAIPYTIFTDPQLAGVGFTEDEQMKQMGVCACRTVSFEDVPKAIIVHRFSPDVPDAFRGDKDCCAIFYRRYFKIKLLYMSAHRPQIRELKYDYITDDIYIGTNQII